MMILTAVLVLPSAGSTLFWNLQITTETWSNTQEAGIFQDARFQGQLALEDSQLTGVGNESFRYQNQPGVFQMSLTIADLTYDQDNDPAIGYPILYFQDGDLSGLDYFTTLDQTTLNPGSFLQLYPDGSMAYSPDGVNEFEGSYQTTQSIPEPRIPLLTLSALCLILKRRLC